MIAYTRSVIVASITGGYLLQVLKIIVSGANKLFNDLHKLVDGSLEIEARFYKLGASRQRNFTFRAGLVVKQNLLNVDYGMNR